MSRPQPIDAAREFRINEMFFSTTDRAGRIRSGNDVFVRVSGYASDALLGHPHNVIRHPDMPRAAFRLLWDYLASDRPFAALVKNLASDGRHYWVVAFLMPIQNGYLSIRFKPSSGLYPRVEALYAEMLSCEREQEAAGADRKTAMAASEARLAGALKSLGFESYEAFMRTLLCDELKARDAALTAQHLVLFPAELPPLAHDGKDAQVLRSIYDESCRAYEQINRLYAQLDEFSTLHADIESKSATVLTHTGDFRYIAFNAALRSARLGEEGRGLGVISDYLGTTSTSTAQLVRGLAARIHDVSTQLRAVIFSLAAARLQIEMVLSFCAELGAALAAGASGGTMDPRRVQMITDLQQAFAATIQRAVASLEELERGLPQLGATSEELRRNILTLQVAQVGGMVEASRLQDDDSFLAMFADLRSRVDATKHELVGLNDIGTRLSVLAAHTPEIAAIISAAVDGMGREVASLSRGDMKSA